MYLLKKNRHTIFGRKVQDMEKAKRRVRVCLICVVLLAIVVGIFYYYNQMGDEALQDEGTLVFASCADRRGICQ